MKNMVSIVLKRSFSCLGLNLIEIVCEREREGETDREALGLINCSIHILDESELELA